MAALRSGELASGCVPRLRSNAAWLHVIERHRHNIRVWIRTKSKSCADAIDCEGNLSQR